MAIRLDTKLVHVLPIKDFLSNCLINNVQIFNQIEMVKIKFFILLLKINYYNLFIYFFRI